MPSNFRLIADARRLAHGEQRAALRALGWLACARAALWILPHALVSSVAARIPPSRASVLDAVGCARAVTRASRVLSGSSCLVRAIAAQCLLRREGLPATLVLGVALDTPRQLRAHAWVKSRDIVVTGGAEAAAYAPLSPPGA